MNIISNFSSIIAPIFILIVVIAGVLRKVDVFEAFKEGVLEGLNTLKKILPVIVGLFFAVGVFRVSGLLGFITEIIKPLTNLISFPSEMLPLVLIRPISASGAMLILKDIFATNGVDSYIGKASSIIMGSSETILYVMTIYFGAIKIKNTGNILKIALFLDIIVIVIAIILARVIV